MEVILVSEKVLSINSHKGKYHVNWGDRFSELKNGLESNQHLIIDKKVADIYFEQLRLALSSGSVLKIEALEENKSIEKIPSYVMHLLGNKIKRGHELVVVGGGILQDIGSFLATVLFRGVSWRFFPTTLLAQADSCIGSKSSINVGSYKNQLGTFTPPSVINISPDVLQTLDRKDFRSGVGEIIKVHLMSGVDDFNSLQKNYDALFENTDILKKFILRSLEIKKYYIEADEFDQNERLLLNFGHSFGHAIESASNFKIPHGIAVTIGLDMSNFLSSKSGLLDESVFKQVRMFLLKNIIGFEKTNLSFEKFLDALSKDKKNTSKEVSVILMHEPGKMLRKCIPFDAYFKNICQDYFKYYLGQ